MRLKRFYSPLFLVGIVFLFNPVVSLVDVLPDFIGALLIGTALTEIAMLDERLENARRLIFYLAAISGVRTALMFSMFDMDETWILSLVTILGVVELFALVYFSISFFGGIGYIAQRSDSENVLGEVDRVKRLWILFFILRVGAAILPEVLALPQQVVRENPDDIPWVTARQLLLYRYYARMLLSTASLFLGVWWLKVSFTFFKGVKKDALFKDSLEKRYGQFLEANPLQELFLDVKFALICLVAGCVLQFGFYADGRAILPAWVGSLLILLALWRADGKNKTPLIIVGAAVLLQALAAHLPLLNGAVESILLAVGSVVAVFLGENGITGRVKKAIDWEIDAYFYITRLFYVAFFVLGIVYALWANYWVHLARLICFGVWIAVIVWVATSVIGEIKLRRRL